MDVIDINGKSMLRWSPTILIICFRNIHGKVYLSNKKVKYQPSQVSLLNSPPKSAADIVTAFASRSQ